MKCQNCGINDANVRYSQNINGDKLELHLCSGCAKKMNIGIDFDMGMEDIFSSFFNEFGGRMRLLDSIPMQCELCGKTYDEFMMDGKIGCPNCYIIFDNDRKKLNEKVKRAENKKDITKTNIKSKEEEKIEKLEEEMKECIKLENYERAAVVRDEIKKIKGEIEK